MAEPDRPGPTMKAAVAREYGPPEVLHVEEVDRPSAESERVLVRVLAASLNTLDKFGIEGPVIARLMGTGLRRPKEPIPGVDFAGVVEAVGESVTRFKPGDEVFGTGPGTLAEYVSAREVRVAAKPRGMTFEEAAAMPVAAVTALQALRDWGGLKPGQTVLINGASGGVGTFAVQIAKAMGAEVTAVCSARNMEQALALGADRVIDYAKEDFAAEGKKYDLVLENAGNKSISDCRRCLNPGGTMVLNAAPRGTMLGFAFRLLKGRLVSVYSDRKVVFHMAEVNPANLDALAKMVEAGQLRSAIEKTYSLDQAPEALAYMGSRHARAKLVVKVAN